MRRFAFCGWGRPVSRRALWRRDTKNCTSVVYFGAHVLLCLPRVTMPYILTFIMTTPRWFDWNTPQPTSLPVPAVRVITNMKLHGRKKCPLDAQQENAAQRSVFRSHIKKLIFANLSHFFRYPNDYSTVYTSLTTRITLPIFSLCNAIYSMERCYIPTIVLLTLRGSRPKHVFQDQCLASTSLTARGHLALQFTSLQFVTTWIHFTFALLISTPWEVRIKNEHISYNSGSIHRWWPVLGLEHFALVKLSQPWIIHEIRWFISI